MAHEVDMCVTLCGKSLSTSVLYYGNGMKTERSILINKQQQQLFNGPLSRTTWVSRYQKGKTNLDLWEQDTVSGSGIRWAICISAPRPRQITTPAPHHSVLQAGCPFCCQTISVKALKTNINNKECKQ